MKNAESTHSVFKLENDVIWRQTVCTSASLSVFGIF